MVFVQKKPKAGEVQNAETAAAPESSLKRAATSGSTKSKKTKKFKSNPHHTVAPKTFVSGSDVPQLVKDLFYDLASVRADVRYVAVDKVAKTKLSPSGELYILGRLIAGCATGHRAARLGFPAALSRRLQVVGNIHSIDQILEITHDRLKVIAGVNDQVIGRQCVYASIINSGVYTEHDDLLKILTLEFEAYKKYPYLRYYIVETISDIAMLVGVESFFSEEYSAVNLLPKTLTSLKELTPELLYLVLRLRRITAVESAPKLETYLKKGKFVCKLADHQTLISIIMETTAVGMTATLLPTELYTAAVESGVSKEIFNKIILKALHFDLSKKESVSSGEKTYEHGAVMLFRLVTQWLNEGIMPTDEAIILLSSKTFLRRLNAIDADVGLPCTPNNSMADLMLQAALKYFKGRVVTGNAAYLLLEAIASIGEAESTSLLRRLKATKQLLVVLGTDIMESIVEKILKKPSSPLLRHVLEAFPGTNTALTLANRIELLAAAGQEFLRNSQGIVTEVLSQCFYKPNRHSDLRTFKDTTAVFLRTAAKNVAKFEVKETKNTSKHVHVLNTTRALLAILEKLSIDDEEKVQYHVFGKELEAIVGMKKIDIDAIVGKTVELVSGRGRIMRSIAYVLMTEFADLVTSEQILVLGATLTKVEADLEDEEDDDDFTPITAEDLVNLEKDKTDENDDDDDESMDESEAEEDSDAELPPLKPEFVAAMKKALGNAAITDSDDEDVAMDDAELSRVDARLSVVMAQFSAAGKKAAKEESRKQRYHIGELLAIALHAAPITEITASFPIIFDLLILTSEFNRDDITQPVVHAMQQLSTRTVSELLPELGLQWSILAKRAAAVHGAKLRNAVQQLSAFLFKAAYAGNRHDDAVKDVLNVVEKYYEEKTPKSGVGAVIIGVIGKNLDTFAPYLGRFFVLFTKTNKRGEAATLIKVFNRKDIFSMHKKPLEAVSKKILAHYKVAPSTESKKTNKTIVQAFKLFCNKTNFLR